ncbi:MAG TPA: hypothetical protein VGS22_07545 [Thermoanaerobaculia bacterium]|jgi:hypothetical protein|nr:hypothetical protein [Thermoanaerobaculia bacterium]
MARKLHFTWPPPGDEDKQFHNEVAAVAAILQALGADIDVGPPRENLAKARHDPPPPSLRDWLKSKDSGMGGLTLGGGRSWNHPQLLMAARGLVFNEWGDAGKLMAMQAGRSTGEGLAQFLDGEEPRSTDYDSFRWAAYLIFASNKAPAAIRDDAREVLRRQMRLAMLGAVPWTDEGLEFRNAQGELTFRGPTLSPVGERSPKTSHPDQCGLFCRLVLGQSNLGDRDGWAPLVADMLGIDPLFEPRDRATLSDPTAALALLGNARVLGVFRFVEYPEGRFVFRANQMNPNTPSALWSFADHAKKRQVRGFPFDPEAKNRGKGAPRSIGCTIENGEVVARSTDDRFTARFRLPTSTPLWSIIVDEQGARFENGNGPILLPSQPPPHPPEPSGNPAIDIQALVAAVFALGAQPDQTDPAVALVQDQQWQKASEAVAALSVPNKRRGDRNALAAQLQDLAEDE